MRSQDSERLRAGRTADAWRRAAPWLLAALFYVAFTLFQTWPLIDHLSDVMASDLGDPLLNTWIVWWNAHALPFTTRWWNAPAFWPSTGALGFSEVLLGLSPITTPVQWLGGSPVAAYNVAFLLTFPLSALAAHALAYRLTGRHDAALIAGLVYGFHPFRAVHFPHIQVITSYWMPLALLGLHEYLARQERRWLVLFGGAWLMQALSNGYYLLFLPVLLGSWIVWFVREHSAVRMLGAIAGTWLVASFPLIPLLWTYRRIHATFGFERAPGEVNTFSADVTALLNASPLLKFWDLQSFHQPDGGLFPGFTSALLVVLLIGTWLWKSPRPTRVPRTAMLLLAASGVFFAVALSALLLGPWSLDIGRTTLLSVRVISKPLSTAVLLFLAALAMVLNLSGPWRRRSPVMFYVLALGLMYLLCFGPRPHLFGESLFLGPYSLLMLLPGYDAVRVPARFAMLGALCLSVVAAFAFTRLTSRTARTSRLVLATVVICGILVDSAIGTLPLQTLPLRFFALEGLAGSAAVMELPLGDVYDDAAAMYRGMYHARPVVNGYSGYYPMGYEFLRRRLALHDPQMFDAVAVAGPVIVVVDTARDAEGRWVQQLTARPGAALVLEEAGRKMFSLPGGVPPPDLGASDRVPVQWASANVNSERMSLALDGKDDTRWNSGPQSGTEVVTLDFGSTRFIDGLTMTLGPHMSEFPRTLVIETSDDASRWTARWEGSAAAAAFAAAVREPDKMPLTFGLPHVPARWLRLRQIGQDPVYYWSIFELNVFGS